MQYPKIGKFFLWIVLFWLHYSVVVIMKCNRNNRILNICFHLCFRYTCILCHQEDIVGRGDGPSGRPMVLGGLIQRSTVLSRNRARRLEQPENHDPLILPADMHWGVHTSSCGHAMHAQCWQKYFDDVLTKERRRPYRWVQSLQIENYRYHSA